MRKTILAGIIVSILGSCGTNIKEAGYDTEAIKQEIQDRKIKRVTESELRDWIYLKSPEIASALNKDLVQNILAEIDNKDFNLEKYIQNYQSEVKDSLAKTYMVDIQLLPLIEEEATQWKGKQKEVIEAYLYNKAEKIPLEQNIQKIENGAFFFTAPVKVLTAIPSDKSTDFT